MIFYALTQTLLWVTIRVAFTTDAFLISTTLCELCGDAMDDKIKQNYILGVATTRHFDPNIKMSRTA